MLVLYYIKRHSPYAAAVLQVSILNGTDLKTMINYTGEQVSPRAPFPKHIQKSVFTMLGPLLEFLIC